MTRARRLWLFLGAAAAAGAVVAVVAVTRTPGQAGSHAADRVAAVATDPIVQDFRAVERTCIQTFNDALRRQRANEVDELGLADLLDRDVLPPWRAMRARVEAAPVPDGGAELYATLRRYLAERQTGWEAYATALRAPSDAAARPAYDAYHQATDAATRDAQALGAMFRRATPGDRPR